MFKTLSVLIALTATVTLSGCQAQSGSPSPVRTTTPTAEPVKVWSPTLIKIGEAEGKQVEIAKGGFIEISTIGAVNPNSWLPASSNPDIAKAYNGSPSNFATPIVEGLAQGEATITVTNSVTGQVVTFAVKVKG